MRLKLALVLLLLLIPATSSSRKDAVSVSSSDGSLTVTVTPAGIASAVVRGRSIPSLSGGKTQLVSGTLDAPGSCMPRGSATVDSEGGTGAVVKQRYLCTVPVGARPVVVELQVTDSFRPGPHGGAGSVVVSTSIITVSGAAPFSTALSTALHWDAGALGDDANLWLPWQKGCVHNGGGACYGSSAPWQPALDPEPLPDAPELFRYGAGGGLRRGGRAAPRDGFTLPIVSVSGADDALGLSLVLDPSDPLLEVTLRTSQTGVAFDRELLRLGVPSRPVTFEAHLVAHAAGFRPGLGFMVETWPEYFMPWVDDAVAASYEGLGSYSWNQEPYDVSRARALGFKTNWDLSGTFMPYDGLFLPYVEDEHEPWRNLGPINSGLTAYNVTYAMINAYYAKIQAQGFHSLSYFDIGNWGTVTDTNYTGPSRFCGTRPNGEPAPCPGPDGANAYLRDKLLGSNYPSWGDSSCALLHHGWSVLGGRFTEHHYDWVGTTDMDTQVPAFEDLIVEQCARHIEKLPAFEGIAIDRLDYSEFFNFDADDDVSWVPVNCSSSTASTNCGASANVSDWTWGPARAIRLSYRHTFDRLHRVLHANASSVRPAKEKRDKESKKKMKKKYMMLNNCNQLCRLDEMRAFDGSFSEGSALNAVAWTGLRQPTILWTYGLENDTATLDAYFQQHLLMNVYPMAPMPLNDHSIQPSEGSVMENAYMDYAPLFDIMHGARWLLTPRPIFLSGTADHVGHANALTLPTGNGAAAARGELPRLLVPVMLAAGSNSSSVKLGLRLGIAADAMGWPSVQSATLSALYPGGNGVVHSVGEAAVVEKGVFQIEVPLRRGCAMVLVVMT